MSDAPDSGNGISMGKIVLDTSSIASSRQQVVSDSQKIKEAFDSVGKSTDDLEGKFKRRLTAIIENARAYGREAGTTAKQLDLFTQAVKKATDQPADLAARAKKAAADVKDAANDIETAQKKITVSGGGFSAIGSLLNKASPGAGNSFIAGGQAINAVTGFSKYAAEADNLAKVLLNAGGATQGFARAGVVLTGIIPGISAGLGAIAGIAAPFVVGIGAAALAYQSLLNTISDGDQKLQAAINSLNTYYDAIQTGTTESISKQLEVLKLQKTAADNELNTIKTAFQKAAASELKADPSTAGLKFIGASLFSEGFKEAQARQAELEKQSKGFGDQIGALERALGSASVASNDARDRLLNSVQGLIDTQQTYNQLISLSSEAAKQKVKDLTAERDVTISARDALVQSGDTSLAVQSKIAVYNKTIEDEGQKIDFLNNQGIKLIQTREAEKKAAEDQIKAIQKAQAAVEKLNNDLVQTGQKRDDDIKNIEDKGAADRIALQERTRDKIAEILQKAIDDADKALEQLDQRKEDLLRDAGRNEGKDNRKQDLEDLKTARTIQVQEREDLVSHLRKVRDIKLEDLAGERQALLRRNFLSLFELQRNQKDKQDAENQAFEDEKQDRIDHQNEAAQANRLDRIAEANERHIAIQQKLEDLQLGYQRELRQIDAAKNREITLTNNASVIELTRLNTKIINELNLREAGYRREIQLLTQTEDQKAAIYRKYLLEAYQVAGASAGATSPVRTSNPYISSSRGQAFGNGGDTQAGNWFMYNDGWKGQRESFGGHLLPEGLGMAFPFQSGRIDANGGTSSGGNTYQLNATINEVSNPRKTYRQVVSAFDKLTRTQ